MIRNFKALGLALVAALALAGIGGAAAWASEMDFDAGSSTGTLHATQTTGQVFTTSAGTVTCSTSTQSGTFTAATIKEFTATATYGGCKAFGFISATIDMNGCQYKFTASATGGAETTGLASIVNCTNAAKDITVTTLGCVVHVPEQNNIPHIIYTNTGGTPDDVDANITLSGITYTTTEGCPGGNIGIEQHDGTLTGKATIVAKETSGTQTTLTATDG